MRGEGLVWILDVKMRERFRGKERVLDLLVGFGELRILGIFIF